MNSIMKFNRKPKISVLLTGGSISMVTDPIKKVLVPSQRPEDLLAIAPELGEFFDFDLHTLANIDSTNVTPQHWQVLAQKIMEERDKYFSDVAQICSDLSVPYCNTNLAPEFLTEEWLFVDRVHLTDRGCQIAAQILKREFNL